LTSFRICCVSMHARSYAITSSLNSPTWGICYWRCRDYRSREEALLDGSRRGCIWMQLSTQNSRSPCVKSHFRDRIPVFWLASGCIQKASAYMLRLLKEGAQTFHRCKRHNFTEAELV
jgi:hypothetical protein